MLGLTMCKGVQMFSRRFVDHVFCLGSGSLQIFPKRFAGVFLELEVGWSRKSARWNLEVCNLAEMFCKFRSEAFLQNLVSTSLVSFMVLEAPRANKQKREHRQGSAIPV